MCRATLSTSRRSFMRVRKNCLALPKDDRADARLLKPAVLLDDCDDPGRELRELSVELTHKLFTAGNVQRACDFLEDDALPRASRERDDVLAAVVGYEESGEFLQLLIGFRE